MRTKQTKPSKKFCCADSSDMRRRLLKATVELIGAKGLDHVSVRDIVARCGVTKPVLYYYFKDKDDLLRQIGEQATQDLLMATRELEQGKQSVEEFIRDMLIDSMERNLRHPHMAKMAMRMMSLSEKEDKFAGYFFKMIRQHTVILKKAFAAAEKRGELPTGSAEITLAMSVAASQYYMAVAAIGNKNELKRTMPGEMTEIIMAGIKAGYKGKAKK
jgi:AcrR family transcriptional regulator